MKVLHSGTLDVNNGGPAMSTYLAVLGLRNLGVDAEVISFCLGPNGKMRGNDIPVHFTPQPIFDAFEYSPVYKRDLRAAGDYDIYHAQGVWLYPTYALVDVAKEKGKPYIITPRGMLYPQDIAKSSKFAKKFSLWWRLRDDLNKAACVHVTCMEEMKHCRDLGVTSPMAVVPNPVEIVDYSEQKRDDVFRVGYLGRLSPRKNVEGLIRAFAEIGDEAKKAELLIIGGGDNEYEAYLRKEAERLGVTNVKFAGFLSGKEKNEALASCSILAMPSEFENLGNVILEGLVRKIPCMATTGSPWEELNTQHCGWWVRYNQSDITEAIRKAMKTNTDELKQMGERGRKLMEERYSVAAVATKIKQMYDWILDKGEKPEFIYL
ncbi:MAG: glycosyltransferase [Bacteroidales bacterium]|nr:glycosyltransferase [Bacteroidales bacterium]